MIKFIKKYRYDLMIGIIILASVLLAYFQRDSVGFLSSREAMQSFLMSFGALAPIVLILVIIAEVVIAPIPGFIPALTAGFLFGPILGSVYTYIGNFIGSLIVFLLIRKFGRLIAGKFVEEARIKRYEKAIARNENILLALYFFPLFPLDVITAMFGLSSISRKKFIITIAIGYVLYALILNIFGDYLAEIFFNYGN